MRIITLLTDFGVESTYPAQMKGVILGRCTDLVLVDLTHAVPRHEVRTAAFMLASAAPAFPPGTVHMAVVDPQVGSPRRILAAEGDGHLYLAPDNGLLTLVAQGQFLFGASHPPARVVSVENQSFFRRQVSSTFHGRDIFAPVAAAMACGTPIDELGPEVESIERFDLPLPDRYEGDIRGEVLYVDPFGNLVTNISSRMLAELDPSAIQVYLEGAVVRGLSRAYSDVPAGILLAYIGSAGLLEIAVNRQSAAVRLGAGVGTPLVVNPASA
jgi:S-adenosylmethionine hydrolase